MAQADQQLKRGNTIALIIGLGIIAILILLYILS